IPSFHELFSFQEEEGIRGGHVTGVQTCALPISSLASSPEDGATIPRTPPSSVTALTRKSGWAQVMAMELVGPAFTTRPRSPSGEIGRASCRERALVAVGAGVVSGQWKDEMRTSV